MPSSLLNKNEINTLKATGVEISSDGYIDEHMREFLTLRDTDKKIKIIGTKKHKS